MVVNKQEKIQYEETPAILSYGFFLYVIIWYLQLGSRWHFFGSIRIEMLIAILLLIGVFLYKTPSVGGSGVEKSVIAYLFVCFLSVLFSVNVSVSWNIFYDYVLKFAIYAFFIVSIVKSPRVLKIFLFALLVAWLKIGQEGFVGTITGGMMWMNQGVMRLHGVTGYYAHPNSYSGFAIGTIPFIYYFFPIVNKYIKILLLVQLVFSLNIVLHAGSRTGYVAFCFIILFLLFEKRKNFKKFLTILFFVFCVINIVPSQYMDRFDSIFTGQDKAGRSTEKRKEIIDDAFAVFLDRPFGVGVGAFPLVREEYFGRKQDTHNLYLQIATNLGIQGLVLFFCLMWKIIFSLRWYKEALDCQFRELNKLSENCRNGNFGKGFDAHVENIKLYKAFSSALLMFLYCRLVLGIFGHDLYEIYWWFLVGSVMAIGGTLIIIKKKTNSIVNSCS